MRKTELKRRTPIKRGAIRKRRQSRQQTERVYGSAAFREHVHSSACLWCGITRPIEQAHFGKHGMGKKNDWTATGPLCSSFTVGTYTYAGCHNRLDRRGCPSKLWFNAEERHTLFVRQQQFVANWTARQAEWL